MYLDSANITELKEVNKFGVIKGVTTNPTILLHEKKPKHEIINEILSHTDGDVFVQVSGKTLKDINKSAEEIMKISSERIILKIPIDVLGMKLINDLKKNKVDIPLLGTAIFSEEQAILAGIVGCKYVAPYINRMENNNIDPYQVIRRVRQYYEQHNIDTQILGASFKNVNQVMECLYTGADTVTVPYNLFKDMVIKKLATESIETFNQHDLDLKNYTKGD